MSIRALAVSALVVAALVVLGVWLLDLSFERAAILAPVLVISAGATAFLVVLWAKVIYESARRSRGSASTKRSTSDSSL